MALVCVSAGDEHLCVEGCGNPFLQLQSFFKSPRASLVCKLREGSAFRLDAKSSPHSTLAAALPDMDAETRRLE